MVGIIGETISYFEEDSEMSAKSGSILYSVSFGGMAVEAMDELEERGIDYVLITKTGRDMQGESVTDALEEDGVLDECNTFKSHLPSAVNVDGVNYLRNTAPTDIKCGEIVSACRSCNVDSLLISACLLSASPSSEEIVAAVEELSGSLESIVIDASDSTTIMLLEKVKEASERIAEAVGECYVAGDAVETIKAKKVGVEFVCNKLK